MTNSRDWENGGPEDRRGVERDSPLQQERNVMRKKWAIAVVALLAGALMLPNHEALARGGGGGGHGGLWRRWLPRGWFRRRRHPRRRIWQPRIQSLFKVAGDLTTKDLAAEDSAAGSAAASEIMDFMAAATLITTTTTAAIIRS